MCTGIHLRINVSCNVVITVEYNSNFTCVDLKLETLERLRLATAFRDSRSAIHLEEEQDQVWEHSSSPKLEKNTQTG